MCCRGLHRNTNPAYLSRFRFSALLGVAPYCVPGGIRVVSISSSYSPDTIVHRRPARFNLWKKEDQRFHRSDVSMKLRSLGSYGVRPVVPSSTSTSSRLTSSSTVQVCPLLPTPSCASSPVSGGSRVFTVHWDYVETPLGTARPITQAVGKIQGGSCGQKG
jgi:hypothetical protein